MSMTPIALGSGSSPSRFAAGGAAHFVNCYLEKQGEDAKAPGIVVASDGLTEFATLPTTGIRAAIEVGDYFYCVFGRVFYRVDTIGNYTVLGNIPTDEPVTIVRNRRTSPQIGIVSDRLYYVYDTVDGSFTRVTGPSSATDFEPTSITILDGYGILPVSNSKWYTTALDDLTSVDALDFAEAESDPDDIVRAATREGEVVLFGRDTIEWWQDTGGTDFAFARSQAIRLGCIGAGVVAAVDRTLAWIAQDGTVRLMSGYGGDRISDHAVERAIASVDPSTISATSWWRNGHTFYAISSAEWSWVYDLATSKWHERKSYDQSRWDIAVCARFGLQWLAGSSSTGELYVMSPDAMDEDGTAIVMTVQTPPVHAFPYRLQFNAIYVDIVPGVGLNTTAAAELDPELMVSWSDNGGQTWSTERRIALGRLGKMTQRAVARRLGISNQIGRTFKFSISASVARAFLGASVDVDKLAA
jgi:hypothetical protein